MTDKDMTSIEKRLRDLEDHMQIRQVVCGYGYAVDGLNADAVGAFYAENAVFAVRDVSTLKGRKQIAAITENPDHQALVTNGCAHVTTPPYVVIDGDRAIATCHTMLLRHGESGFYIARLSAARIELSRKPAGGWQIDHRQNHILQGDPAGPDVLARLNEGPG